MLSQTTLLLALAASASAHIVMLFPKPFANSSLNNSPLASAAEFPCKKREGMYNVDLGINQWNAGETQSVRFMGAAVHGGGSCQFSITTDPEPTKDSQWKVIQSNEGNCPSDIGQDQNLPSDSPSDTSLPPFPVKMPSNIPDGRYTFAWTWINRVGNREFYMNCAPIQVGTGTAAASTASVVDALGGLPDMFVINLPATQCASTAYEDFKYPNPGKNVVVGTKNVKLGATLSIDTGCAIQNKMGAGAGQLGSPTQGTPSTPSQGNSPVAPSKSSVPSQPSYAPSQPQQPAATPGSGYGTPQPSKIPTNPNGGVYAPGASSAPAAVPSPQSPPAAAQPSPPAAKPVPSTTPQAPQTPQTPSGNTSSPSNSECTPCTNDGAVVCIGSKQFGLCNRGCAVAQDLAAGMTCSAGAVVASSKRHLHFPRAHLHRRFTAARFL